MPDSSHAASRTDARAPSTAELIERARALVPALRGRAAAAETARSVPARSIDEIRAASLLRVLQPEHHGGLGRGFADYLGIVDQLARGCGSTAWVYSNAVLHTWHLGMFGRAAQDDVWGADPDAFIASSYAPTGTASPAAGGYALRGRWNYASGCDHAAWLFLGARVPAATAEATVTQGWFLVPRGDYRIVDNWHVMGLAATGSKDILVEDAFVPAHRMLTVAEAQSAAPAGAALCDHPIYRVPLYCSFSFFLAGPIVGMAQGALDDYVALVKGRATRGGVQGGGVRMADFPTIQLRVGGAAMKIDAARAVLLQEARATLEAAATPAGVDMDQRFRNRRAQCVAVRLAREAVDELFESAGASGVFLDSATQRVWRDVHAAAMHFSLNWDAVRLMAGQYALDLDPAGMY